MWERARQCCVDEPAWWCGRGLARTGTQTQVQAEREDHGRRSHARTVAETGGAKAEGYRKNSMFGAEQASRCFCLGGGQCYKSPPAARRPPQATAFCWKLRALAVPCQPAPLCRLSPAPSSAAWAVGGCTLPRRGRCPPQVGGPPFPPRLSRAGELSSCSTAEVAGDRSNGPEDRQEA